MSIQDFVQTAAVQLGADTQKVESAVGGLLGMIRAGSDNVDFQQLMRQIPDAERLIPGAPQSAENDALSGLVSLARAALGNVGTTETLRSLLGSGLDVPRLRTLAFLFFDFAKDSAGGALVNRLLRRMPDLQVLAG